MKNIIIIIIILLFSIKVFSQKTPANYQSGKSYTSLQSYKQLFGNNFSKSDSLSFIIKENDTLIPFPDDFKRPEGISVEYESKDSIFLEIYKDLVYKKYQGAKNNKSKKLAMRYWKNNITIYFSKSVNKTVKRELKKFANYLSTNVDSLNISFVNRLEKSTYVIYDFNSKNNYKYEQRIKGNKNLYHFSWDGNQRIYDCKLQLNSDSIQNISDLVLNSKKLFLQTLGHFNYTSMLPKESFFSSLDSKNKKFTKQDLEILKYHYSYGICKGTDIETFEKQHETAKNTYEKTGRNMFFFHNNK